MTSWETKRKLEEINVRERPVSTLIKWILMTLFWIFMLILGLIPLLEEFVFMLLVVVLFFVYAIFIGIKMMLKCIAVIRYNRTH